MKLFIYCCLLLWSLLPQASFAEPWQQERMVYQQGLQAIQNGDMSHYAASRRLLKDYPLLAYFEYHYLSTRFAELPDKAIAQFLQRHQGTFVAQRLSSAWLSYLGEQGHWALFDSFYQADSAGNALQCYHLESRLAKNPDAQSVFAQVSLLWLKPYSLPKACDRLLAAWQTQGQLNEELAWQRFQLSYADGNTRLANYLVRYLSRDKKILADALFRSKSQHSFWLDYAQEKDIELSSAVMARLLRSLSSQGFAVEIANIIRSKPAYLHPDDLLELQQISAWHMARISGDKASAWLASIQADEQPGLSEYQLRYAMQDKNWLLYQKLFNRLSQQVQDNDEWLYWYAIAQQHSTIEDSNPYFQSEAIFKRLATRRSFYGFLSAERRQQPISLVTEAYIAPEIDPQLRKDLAIALELYHIGDLPSANREWHYVTRHYDDSQWQQAGLVAQQAQWHDKTILAFAKAKQWQAIDARFPLAWQDLFYKYSRQNVLEQSWLLAMARQESGFSTRAQSPVGAMGVLQLMPNTAKRLAKNMQTPYTTQRLFDADYNIALGSQYLKNLLQQFDNNYILATAAYNAGPARVKQWLSQQPLSEDWVHWVATIPYPETRNYVQNILTYSRIYQSRLGEEESQLSLLLPKSEG